MDILVTHKPGDIYTDIEVRNQNTTIDLGYCRREEVIEILQSLNEASIEMAEAIEEDDVRNGLMVVSKLLKDLTDNDKKSRSTL